MFWLSLKLFFFRSFIVQYSGNIQQGKGPQLDGRNTIQRQQKAGERERQHNKESQC